MEELNNYMKKQRKCFKWLVLGAIIIGVIIIGVETSLYLINDTSKNNKIESNHKEQDVKDDDENTEVNDIMNDEEQSTGESETKPEEGTQQEEIQQKPVEVQNKTENITNTKPNENNTQVQKPVEEQKPVEQPKPKTPWEELGISEYDYYNKPEIEWQTVDFSVEKYGSQANAKQACIDAGSNNNELERYTFRCDETYSYSHKFLGYHIKYTIIP